MDYKSSVSGYILNWLFHVGSSSGAKYVAYWSIFFSSSTYSSGDLLRGSYWAKKKAPYTHPHMVQQATPPPQHPELKVGFCFILPRPRPKLRKFFTSFGRRAANATPPYIERLIRISYRRDAPSFLARAIFIFVLHLASVITLSNNKVWCWVRQSIVHLWFGSLTSGRPARSHPFCFFLPRSTPLSQKK